MPRLPHLSASLMVAVALAMAGCTDEGGPNAANTRTPFESSQKTGKDQKPGQEVTPDRKVDTSKVDSVVKGEIEGGESKNPTPIDLPLLRGVRRLEDPRRALRDRRAGSASTTVTASIIPSAEPHDQGAGSSWASSSTSTSGSRSDATVSCASCHDPAKGWTDNMKTSVGIKGQVGGRNAPTVLNTVYGRSMFWDGRAPSLEGQAQGPDPEQDRDGRPVL